MATPTNTPCTIYALVEQGIPGIRYVGKTRQPLWRRFGDHVAKSSATDTRPVLRWIFEVCSRGGHVEILPLQENANWNIDEAAWIKRLTDEGADLLNIELHSQKKSELMLQVYSRPGAREHQRQRSREASQRPEQRAALSAATKGKPHSAEHNASMREAIVAMAAKPEHKERLSRMGAEQANNQLRLHRSAETHRTPEARAAQSIRTRQLRIDDPSIYERMSEGMRRSWARRKAMK